MSFMVEENEPLDPVDVGLFRLIAVVSNTEDVTNLVKQFGLVRVRRTKSDTRTISRGRRVRLSLIHI